MEQFQTPLFNLPTEKSLDSFLERNLVLGWTSKHLTNNGNRQKVIVNSLLPFKK